MKNSEDLSNTTVKLSLKKEFAKPEGLLFHNLPQ